MNGVGSVTRQYSFDDHSLNVSLVLESPINASIQKLIEALPISEGRELSFEGLDLIELAGGGLTAEYIKELTGGVTLSIRDISAKENQLQVNYEYHSVGMLSRLSDEGE